ncbi:MAG: 50S ribosomal protein L3 [gamma proteobacterium endosymbiont of Trioza apicalis]
MNGLIGRKLGMTTFFDKNGISIPVTVIEIKFNYVTQIKNIDTHGYCSIQITTGNKYKNINKAESGHFIKNNIKFGRGLWEFRVKNIENIKIGKIFNVDFFINIKKVDITGFSKGKGFSGTVKRWNFRTQDSTHGNSLSHRAPGSIGQNQTPGRVFKGKKMAGHLGNEKITTQNLNIIHIDSKYNLLIIKGSVPGFNGCDLIVKPSIKYSY